MSILLSLGSYADLRRLVEEPAYAQSKHLLVKEVRNGTAKGGPLHLVRYDKHFLNANNIECLGMFRSVIVQKGRTLAFSPPKSLPLDLLHRNFPDSMGDKAGPYSLVEGTMVNAFYDPLARTWEIATCYDIAGSDCNAENKRKTFRMVFLEAMETIGICFNMLDRAYSYSFVLQYPCDRIATPISRSTITLINIYKCIGSDVIALSSREVHTHGRKIGLETPRLLKELIEIGASSPETVVNLFRKGTISHHIPGAVFYYSTGIWTKIRNPRYEELRPLRWSSSKLQYQYYYLRRLGKVWHFLKLYPQYKKYCGELREELHAWTFQLWSNYVSCYIRKEKALKAFPKEFQPHMYNLHQKYLNELVRSKLCITRRMVIKYVNSLAPRHLIFSINYKHRSRDIRGLQFH